MFYERFVQLCEGKNLKVNPAGKKIGLSSGLLSKWKKEYEAGENPLPNGDKLIAIVDFFQCSADYILDRTDVFEVGGPANAWLFSKEEMKLVECFRESNERKQMQLLGLASGFAEEAEKGTGETSEDHFA